MMDENNNLLLFPLTEASGRKIDSDVAWQPVPGTIPQPGTQPLVAVDFETYYSTKYSLGEMSTWEYCNHPAFDPYLVALRRWDGNQWWSWVGHPKDAPWGDLANDLWLSHNAGFDELVYRVAIARGMWTGPVRPHMQWLCTADMSAFMQAGRSLKAAAKNLLGIDVSKDVREQMKFGGATSSEIREYAANDSLLCAELFVRWGHKWSEVERFLSCRTRHQGWKGIAFNRSACEDGIRHLTFIKDQVARQLPWYGKAPPTSNKAYVQACYQKGILPAESLSADSASAAAWEDQYGDQYPWISLIRRYTKAHQTQNQLQLLLDRGRRDDTVPFQFLYSKAMPTRRWQHAEGLRIQNLDKSTVEGIAVRHMLVPRPKHVFVIADLSQIEPRVLNWLAGDEKFLSECAKGASPYEAHARSSMGYNKPGRLKDEDKDLYALAKVRVLALGYGAGPDTFTEMARTMCGLTIFPDDRAVTLPSGDVITGTKLNNMLKSGKDPHIITAFNERKLTIMPSAISAVRDFRDSSPRITSYWRRTEDQIRSSIGRNHCVTLPSGYTLRYFDVKERSGEIVAWVVRNSSNVKDQRYVYGGKLVENEVQAESRNVFADCLYRIESNHQKLCRTIFTVHDEVVVEVPECHAEEGLQAVLLEMNTAPSWARGLPVAAEGEIAYHYQK